MRCISEQTLRGLTTNFTTLAPMLSKHELWQWNLASANFYLLEAPTRTADIRKPCRGQLPRCMIAIASLIGSLFHGQPQR